MTVILDSRPETTTIKPCEAWLWACEIDDQYSKAFVAGPNALNLLGSVTLPRPDSPEDRSAAETHQVGIALRPGGYRVWHMVAPLVTGYKRSDEPGYGRIENYFMIHPSSVIFSRQVFNRQGNKSATLQEKPTDVVEAWSTVLDVTGKFDIAGAYKSMLEAKSARKNAIEAEVNEWSQRYGHELPQCFNQLRLMFDLDLNIRADAEEYLHTLPPLLFNPETALIQKISALQAGEGTSFPTLKVDWPSKA